MGYTTEFKGELKFTRELKASELACIETFLSKDRRDLGYTADQIYEGGKYGSYWYHIDYELTKDYSGIKWNGVEKSYDMEYIAQWLIDKMKKAIPDFGLTGEMNAQGESFDDRWVLIAEGDTVRRAAK